MATATHTPGPKDFKWWRMDGHYWLRIDGHSKGSRWPIIRLDINRTEERWQVMCMSEDGWREIRGSERPRGKAGFMLDEAKAFAIEYVRSAIAKAEGKPPCLSVDLSE